MIKRPSQSKKKLNFTHLVRNPNISVSITIIDFVHMSVLEHWKYRGKYKTIGLECSIGTNNGHISMASFLWHIQNLRYNVIMGNIVESTLFCRFCKVFYNKNLSLYIFEIKNFTRNANCIFIFVWMSTMQLLAADLSALIEQPARKCEVFIKYLSMLKDDSCQFVSALRLQLCCYC